jgi:energy-coupling factor transport system ATP-binding protein
MKEKQSFLSSIKFKHFHDLVDTLIVIESGSISAMGSPDNVMKDGRVKKIVMPDFSGIHDLRSKRDLKRNDTPPAAIVLRHLSYAYDDVLVLNDIGLDIRAAEFVAIIGENGSGKTTLVKHFNRLLSPTSGEVFIQGKDTRTRTIASLARDVGLVFQNPDHMFFADTVKDEIKFGLKNLNISDEDRAIDGALNEVGLLHTDRGNPHS